MRSEREMVRAIVSWRTGARPGLTFADAELAAIRQPTLRVYGTADPVGTAESCSSWTVPGTCPGSTNRARSPTTSDASSPSASRPAGRPWV
jgi:hypothetical protein